MAGKKKAKKKVGKKKVAKRVSNFKGRTPGARNKPKPKVYAYRVVSTADGLVLGDFANADAARDAIDAQDALHLELRAPAVPEVSDDDIHMMAEGEPAAPAAAKPALMEFDWTIIVRRADPTDTLYSEW